MFSKIILSLWVEIIAAFILLFVFDNLKLFLIFAFITILISINKHVDFLRKLIRINQLSNGIRLLALTRKSHISDEDLSIVLEEQRKIIGEVDWKILEEEFNQLNK